METDKALRSELVNYLENGNAHVSFLEATRNLPEGLINQKLENVPYTFWGLLEHIRIAQHDMVDFITNPGYQHLNWPEDYWPEPGERATRQMWNKTIESFKKDLQDLIKLAKDPKVNLLTPVPHGQGQTVFKEALQIIDHAAYHTGEIVMMRRALNSWG